MTRVGVSDRSARREASVVDASRDGEKVTMVVAWATWSGGAVPGAGD